jgi:tetraacyldisaccharide 4'-kinase
MALRTRLQRGLVALWQRRGWAARVLYPLALVHSAWRAVDAWRYRSGLTRPQRLPRPVIVVGNLYVGGTGKTPLTIELVRALRDRGWHPAIARHAWSIRTARPPSTATSPCCWPP